MTLLRLFLACSMVLFPVGAVLAASGSTYQVDPEADFWTSGHKASGSTYTVSGSFDRMGGRVVGSTYTLESGTVLDGACGDGFADPGESCDDADLAGATCSSQGFSSGTLSCSSSCTFVTSSCTSASSDGGGGSGSGGGGGSTTTSKPSVPTLSDDIGAVENEDGDTEVIVYSETTLLYGTRGSNTTIYVNGSSEGVEYPTSTSWSVEVALEEGENDFDVKAKSSSGTYSSVLDITIIQPEVGDVNVDSSINDYDLSLFARLWMTDSQEADFNDDGIVDDYDFSLLVSRWS